jgi:hypothetical protein
VTEVSASIGLNLPGFSIGINNIEMTGLVSKFGRAKPAGPYLITSRDSGLALDTLQYPKGSRIGALPPNADPQQLWYVRPSGVKDQVAIVSAASHLALDSARDNPSDPHPVTWDLDEKQGQRWQFLPTADGIGVLVKSPHNGKCLALSGEARSHLDEPWAPWFSTQSGDRSQQWIFSLPHRSL